MAPSDDGEERTKSAAAMVLPITTPPRLLVFWERGTRTYELPVRGDLTIGRSRECEISIDHPSISRRHARLHVARELLVEDLGSHNGTLLGGVRLLPGVRVPLARGMLLQVGHASIIAHEVALDTPEPRPAPPRAEAAGPSFVPTTQRYEQLLELVAPSRISVILLGETGSGKEVTARAIHERSSRSRAPFVAFNCAAFPESLIESELFGHERGAFTGATQSRDGWLEAANGGTLFLDELAELPLPVQAKLLRVLEQREVTRLGSVKPVGVDIRFVAATNADLDAMIEAKTFRRDLFYRLNGITIRIPPLRERRDEIQELAATFLEETSRAAGRTPAGISPRALEALMVRDWPGNVRELRNVIERAFILSQGRRLEPEHLGVEDSASTSRPDTAPRPMPATIVAEPVSALPPSDDASDLGLKDDVRALERRRILQALEASAGNQTAAAKLLGISRRALVVRLDAFGLPRPRKR